MINLPEVPKENEDEPQALMSIYINADGEFEDVNIIEKFVGGKWRENIDSDLYEACDKYFLGSVFAEEPKDTLYHVYIKLVYSSSWTDCGTEYNMDVEVLQLITIKRDYSKFLEAQEEFEKQNKLKVDDEKFFDQADYAGYGEVPNITFNDMQKFAKIIATKDVRLAHRILGAKYAEKMLGKKYNEHLAKIEQRREEFRNYLRYNQNCLVYHTDDGYHISKRYGNKSITITYEQISQLSDELLLQNSNEDIFDMLVSTPLILEQFDKYK